MNDLLIYSLKAGACLAVFYLFFKLLLSRDTFHRLNRIVVIAAVVLSFVLPFCVITIYKEIPATFDVTATAEIKPAPIAEPAPAPEPFPWALLAGVVFVGGALMMLSHTLVSVCGVLRLVRTGRREMLDDGVVLVLLPQAVTPFSWWKYIVMSEADYADNGATIIMHERAHLHLRHSLDLIVTDIAGCLQWFNPAMWLLRREMRAIHEYEADEAVLNSGVDAREYQMLLIKKAAGGRWYSIANSFNHSKLKNRITMMLQTKSSRWACAKTLMVLPLTMLALGAFARTAYVTPDDKVKKESTTITIRGTKSLSSEGQPVFIVDGKEVKNLDELNKNDIKNINVLKGDDLVAQYGDKAKSGVIMITMWKEGEKRDDRATMTWDNNNVVVSKKDGEPRTYEIKLDGVRDSAGKAMVWVVDSKEVPETSGEPVKVKIKKDYVITSDGMTLNDDSSVMTITGAKIAEVSIAAAEASVAIARKALELAKDQMSAEEWTEAQAELAKAEKELAAERNNVKTEVRTIRGVMTDGKVVVSSPDEREIVLVADKSGADAKVVDIRIKGSADMKFNKGEEPLVVIDGKVVPFEDIKTLRNKNIDKISVYKDNAVEKYGEKAKNGVIEITTKK